jgi:hypothetical protein
MGSNLSSMNRRVRACRGCGICGWMRASHGRGKGSDWVETTVGWTVQVLRAVHRFKR